MCVPLNRRAKSVAQCCHLVQFMRFVCLFVIHFVRLAAVFLGFFSRELFFCFFAFPFLPYGVFAQSKHRRMLRVVSLVDLHYVVGALLFLVAVIGVFAGHLRHQLLLQARQLQYAAEP